MKRFAYNPMRTWERRRRYVLNVCKRHLLITILQIAWKLVVTWKRFTHPNVAPLRGVNTTLFQLALVYDWAENGNIMEYMEAHPNAPRSTLVLILLPNSTTHLTSLVTAIAGCEGPTTPPLVRCAPWESERGESGHIIRCRSHRLPIHLRPPTFALIGERSH